MVRQVLFPRVTDGFSECREIPRARGAMAVSFTRVMSWANGFASAPAAALFASKASRRTVPEPQKGSRTRSPGEESCVARKKDGIPERSLAGYGWMSWAGHRGGLKRRRRSRNETGMGWLGRRFCSTKNSCRATSARSVVAGDDSEWSTEVMDPRSKAYLAWGYRRPRRFLACLEEGGNGMPRLCSFSSCST